MSEKFFCFRCFGITHLPILKKYICCRYCRGFKHRMKVVNKDPNHKGKNYFPLYLKN